MITIDPFIVAVIVGPLVPFIVGFAVKAGASPRVKAVVSTVAAAGVAVVANAVIPETGVAVVSWRMVAQAIVTAVVSGASYTSFWKPAVDLNGKLLPERGLG